MYDRPFNDNSYEQFLNEEKLMGAKCTKCGACLEACRFDAVLVN